MGWLIALVGLAIKYFFDMVIAFMNLGLAIAQMLKERKDEN